MKIQTVIFLSFVTFCGFILNEAAAYDSVPQSIRDVLSPKIDCFSGRKPCDGVAESIKNALPDFFTNQTGKYNFNKRIEIETILRNIQVFFPYDWELIKENFERQFPIAAAKSSTGNGQERSYFDRVLTDKLFADYVSDDFTREVTNCFLNDKCNNAVDTFKIKLYEMVAYGKCNECNEHTMEWLNSIKNKLESDYPEDLKTAIITKEKSYFQLKREKRVFQCLEFPEQSAIDCIQANYYGV
ncbi:uncharacterized protein LOC130669338 [Microplitis mediator]|uniref:uncharacterized protein LOC130669338 n=1 Tax=Microplitis mediator TaxID=375433 RepID=UPI0025575294|nr:uncharacterized protein LOC130669338 [Microplitis mediator]